VKTVTIGVLLLWPLAVLAHAHLEQAVPADGSVLGNAPAQFELQFSEAAHLTALSLYRQGDSQPQKITPLPDSATARFSVPAPPLRPGAYELRYRLVSADGHVMSGAVHFRISAP